MKTYKPEKKTTTVIMMGTNDLRAREYDKCINNFQELAKNDTSGHSGSSNPSPTPLNR